MSTLLMFRYSDMTDSLTKKKKKKKNISATRNGDLLQSVTPSRVEFPEAEGYRISQPRRFGS